MVPEQTGEISQTRAFSTTESDKYHIRFIDQIRRKIGREHHAKRYKARITKFHRIDDTEFKCFITSVERRHQTFKRLVYMQIHWPSDIHAINYELLPMQLPIRHFFFRLAVVVFYSSSSPFLLCCADIDAQLNTVLNDLFSFYSKWKMKNKKFSRKNMLCFTLRLWTIKTTTKKPVSWDLSAWFRGIVSHFVPRIGKKWILTWKPSNIYYTKRTHQLWTWMHVWKDKRKNKPERMKSWRMKKCKIEIEWNFTNEQVSKPVRVKLN